ncbi:scarecrow-like protein 13 [Momordica charantia]|uniref:Scarecrow-like protein 13 n=1 Tax=Momordica charantia TaxID=3673 RepID=A0A6J1BTF4_MOMCH|nr:scarecrow-like protein 13 [Momordica charantia]XP_022132846.1 scarecrow-like protein 13 [Momordica charantia]
MQASQNRQASSGIHEMYHQSVQEIDPYCLSHFHVLENNVCPDTGSQGNSINFSSCKKQFFTLESFPATADLSACNSPSAVSVLSSRSPFSPQVSQSCSSDQHNSFDNTCGSPQSGCSVTDDDNELKHRLKELEISLLGPESDIEDSCYCSFRGGAHRDASVARWNWNKMVEMIPRLNLQDTLITCAQAIHEADINVATLFMDVLGQMVSVSGDPAQRLGAYLLEGLRARLERSGSAIYKALKCDEPTSSELMSYMSILFQICPYFKFAYTSANVVIWEAMANEPIIHIIDFQIAQGSQWIPFIQDLSNRPGGPPVLLRITGVDDSQSAHARGGGLQIVGRRLSQLAESNGICFEFHAAAMSGCEVERSNLRIRPGEALAVNFPYALHHMPDESVSTQNHRDRLLRLVKSLSPKVVTIVEQESNTNTSPFLSRFIETLDYYTAMFESIDAARPRDDKQRIRAEQHCVARDIVNMVACEGFERVERHELLGKWRMRLRMAGFSPYPMSSSVTRSVQNLLREFNENYKVQEADGALYLGWKNRAMATSSAWR